MTDYFYLHGFASGPTSSKGVFLKHQLQESYGIELQIPDFNDGGFADLSVSRQVQQVCDLLTDSPAVVIGSSLGGLTAAWVAERMPQIKELVLLAPAFEFGRRWLARDPEAISEWKDNGTRPFFHYGQKTELPLKYGFVEDAVQYLEAGLTRKVATTIIHGRRDESVPIEVSQTYAGDRPWVKLLEVDSDHSLGDPNTKALIWSVVNSIVKEQLSKNNCQRTAGKQGVGT